MSSETLHLTTQIVESVASVTKLTLKEMVALIKNIYTALQGGGILGEPVSGEAEETGGVKKPSIPLKDIVTAKQVVCLECGKKLKTLRTHLRKAHGLKSKEYYQRYDLDPKKFPLVCKESSAKRSQMAKDRGFGKEGGRKKAE
jgi:predicted transcriptional regulator